LFSPTEHDSVDSPTADPAQTGDQRATDAQAADRVAGHDGHPTALPTADRPAFDDDLRDAAARHDEQPHGAAADDAPNGGRRPDSQVGARHDDETSTTRDDVEPPALDEPARDDPAAEAPADEEPAAAAHAGEPTRYEEATDFKPGDAPAAAESAIWTEDSTRDLRERWREAQLGFVDDPQQAADEIRTLVNEAAEALTAALASHREQLNSWPANGDTEQYRMIVQRYHTFFERLLTL
jgi:hypothetical protein